MNCETNVIVADIGPDVILGLDFLRKGRHMIDIDNNAMILHVKKCPLMIYGSLGCYRIVIPCHECENRYKKRRYLVRHFEKVIVWS